MHERAKQAGPAETLEVRTRLRKSPADAHCVADPEALTDQRIQRDPARDDVAARLLPGQAELVQHLGLHERQLVAAARLAERPAAVEVAVPFQATAGNGLDSVDPAQGALRVGRRED